MFLKKIEEKILGLIQIRIMPKTNHQISLLCLLSAKFHQNRSTALRDIAPQTDRQTMSKIVELNSDNFIRSRIINAILENFLVEMCQSSKSE